MQIIYWRKYNNIQELLAKSSMIVNRVDSVILVMAL